MIAITFACARTDCDAAERIDVTALEASDPVDELMPARWGYDFAGVDEVLHCPEHRS